MLSSVYCGKLILRHRQARHIQLPHNIKPTFTYLRSLHSKRDVFKAIANMEEKNAEKQDKEDDDITVTNIFSTKRPKDAMSGAADGFGNIMKGVFGGAALVVAAPMKGAYDGASTGGAFGATKGFFGGLAMGVAGGAALAVGGVATGVSQVARGIYHTPGAIQAGRDGKDWDSEKGEWFLYNLETEANAILELSDEDYVASLEEALRKQKEEERRALEEAKGELTPEQRARFEEDLAKDTEPAPRPVRKVKELEYYETLGVASNATPAEIKKAYYLKAKSSHPDRHRDDPEAHQKFQKIGEAYQVLSDEKLRSNYDREGKSGVEGAPTVDAASMYAMIFGSEKFEPLIGELQISKQMQNSEDDEKPARFEAKLQKFQQRKREVKCAVSLARKLQQYVEGDVEGFKATISEEATELSQSPFGATLLGVIGNAYTEFTRAEKGSISASFSSNARGIGTRFNIAASGLRAAASAKDASAAHTQLTEREKARQEKKAAEGITDGAVGTADGVEDEEDKKLKARLEKTTSHMVALMWNMSQLDIEKTLSKVIEKVTHDHAVDKATSDKRAEALLLLGEEYSKHGVPVEVGLSDIKGKFSEGMRGGGGEGKEAKK